MLVSFRCLIKCSLDGDTDNEFDGLSAKDQAKVVALAKRIKRDGWLPIMVMIDKDAAERNAIEEGMPCLSSHLRFVDKLYL